MQFPGCFSIVSQGLVQPGLDVGQPLIDAAGTLQPLFQLLQDSGQLLGFNPMLSRQIVLGAQFLFDFDEAFRG